MTEPDSIFLQDHCFEKKRWGKFAGKTYLDPRKTPDQSVTWRGVLEGWFEPSTYVCFLNMPYFYRIVTKHSFDSPGEAERYLTELTEGRDMLELLSRRGKKKFPDYKRKENIMKYYKDDIDFLVRIDKRIFE